MGVLEQSMGNISAMLSSPSLTQPQFDAIGKQMDFLGKFRDVDPTLFL